MFLDAEKSKMSTKTIAAIVVPIAACVVVLLSLGYYALVRRAKGKYNGGKKENGNKLLICINLDFCYFSSY